MYHKDHQKYINDTTIYNFEYGSTFRKINKNTIVLTQKLQTQNYLEYVFRIDSNMNIKNLTRMPNTNQQNLLFGETQVIDNNYYNFYSSQSGSVVIRQYNDESVYKYSKTMSNPNNKVDPQIIKIGNINYVLYFYSLNNQNQFIIQDFTTNIDSLNSQQNVIKTFNQQTELIKIRAKQIDNKYLVIVWVEKVQNQYKIDLQIFSIDNGSIQTQRMINIYKSQSKQLNLLEIDVYESGDSKYMILNYGNDTVYSYSAQISSIMKTNIKYENKQVITLDCNNNNKIGQLTTRNQKGQLDFIFYCQHQQSGLVDLVLFSYTDQQIDNSAEEKQYNKYIVFIVLGSLFIIAIVFVLVYMNKKIQEKKMTDMIQMRRKTNQNKPEITKVKVQTKHKVIVKKGQVYNQNELSSLDCDQKILIQNNKK